VDRRHGSEPAAGHEVDVRLPAEPGFVAALRALVTALAARSELSVDDIEDLQIAVDEACALALPHARQPGAQLCGHVEVMPASVDIVVSVPAGASVVPDRNGFSWTVLSGVADDMHVTAGGGTLAIRFSKQCTSRQR
jgi:serine/threonine-protein kinase RsbW